MKLRVGSMRKKLDVVAVFWIIISSGDLFFCIFHMQLTMYILLAIAFCYLCLDKSIGRVQVNTAICCVIFVGVNFLLNIQYAVISKDMAILLIRLFSLMVICSNIPKQEIMTIYCRILFILSILSIVCYVATMAGLRLPGETTIWFKDKYYIYTIYHTVGRWYKFNRNAGIFWESPAYAIFLNIAVMFLMIGKNNIPAKKRILFLVVYSITIFTTLSTTGWLEFGIVIAAIVFNRQSESNMLTKDKGKEEGTKNTKILIAVIIVALIIVFAYLESTMHIIQYKLIDKEASYGTRSNDTLMALKLAMQRPITGYGLYNKYTLSALEKLNVPDNSNWFSSTFMYFGFPMALLYLGYFCYRLKKLFECHWLSWLLICAAFIVFINSETIGVMTLFLFFLFPIKKEESNKYNLEGI